MSRDVEYSGYSVFEIFSIQPIEYSAEIFGIWPIKYSVEPNIWPIEYSNIYIRLVEYCNIRFTEYLIGQIPNISNTDYPEYSISLVGRWKWWGPSFSLVYLAFLGFWRFQTWFSYPYSLWLSVFKTRRVARSRLSSCTGQLDVRKLKGWELDSFRISKQQSTYYLLMLVLI